MNRQGRTESGVEPVTLDEAKLQCYISLSNADSEMEQRLDMLIKSTRLSAENITWRTLVDSTYKYKVDEFPDGIIKLPYPPVISVTSIEYIDGDGNTKTVDASDYRVDTHNEPARIEPVDSWPVADDRINAVTITYEAGYEDSGNTSQVPEDIKSAMKMLIKFLYDNPDAYVVTERSAAEVLEMPMGTKFMLDQYSARTP